MATEESGASFKKWSAFHKAGGRERRSGKLTQAACPERGLVQELSGHGEQPGSNARLAAASERSLASV